MTAYLLKRALQIVLTLFIFLSIVFFLVNAQPGDVSNVYALNPDFPPETREKLRDLFGVNEPLWKQYLVYVKNVFTGNFGISFSLYPRDRGRRYCGAAAAHPRTVYDRDGALLLSGIRARQDHRLAPRWLDRIRHDARRRHALHGVHALVCPDDDLALCLQGRVVSDRQVPRSGGVAGRADRREYGIQPHVAHSDRVVRHSVCRLHRHGQAARERHAVYSARQRRRVRRRTGGGVAGLGYRLSRLGYRQAHGPADSDISLD